MHRAWLRLLLWFGAPLQNGKADLMICLTKTPGPRPELQSVLVRLDIHLVDHFQVPERRLDFVPI